MIETSISPKSIILSFVRNKELIYSLIKREVISRYRGSILGIFWSFFNPILMLIVYTFVFSVVFKTKWPGGSESKIEFALILFSGLSIYNILSECFNRAPSLIISNVNYVKKVIFPLEIITFVTIGSSLFHFLINLIVWLGFYSIFIGIPNFQLILLPILLTPYLLIIAGCTWFLASLGVFLRDIGQFINVITMVFLFLTPIFFPLSALPDKYHAYLNISPLTYTVIQAREIMIFDGVIDWLWWAKWLFISIFVAWFGYAWFQKTRKGFADVL